MEIKPYLDLLRRWAWLLILTFILLGASTYVVSANQSPLYQAETRAMVSQPPAPNFNLGSSVSSDTYTTDVQLAQTYTQLMTTEPVIQRLSQHLGYSVESSQITVNQELQSQILQLTVKDGNPSRAAEIANSILVVFNEYNSELQASRYTSVEQSLQVQIDQVKGQIVDLETQIQQADGQQSPQIKQLQTSLDNYQSLYSSGLNALETYRFYQLQSSTPNIIPIEQAKVPSTPIQPQPVRNALLAGALGLVLCAGIIFLIEYLDDTFKIPEDISRVLGLPVIGMIGEMERSTNGSGNVYVGENPRSPIAEAYRVLRTNLEFASVDQPLQTLLVTSVGPEEGKTTIAVNLAVIIAQGGKRVMLVDADLRRPTLHLQLNIKNRTGLSDLFLSDPEDVSKVCTWGETKLSVVPSGPLPPNPTDLLGSVKFSQILNKLKENVDILILDSAPSIVSDPIILSTKVDGVLLVIKPGSTKIGAAQVMLEQFQRSGARVVGVVLNPISRNRARYSSKYEYYSKYYQSSSKSESYYSYEGKKNRKKVSLRKSNGNNEK